MRRLLPDPGPTELEAQLDRLEPAAAAGDDRPYVFTNFAVTVDGHATIGGRAGEIGSDVDTALLMGLRAVADAVLVGAGTIRAERYGRLLPRAERRERREQRGLAPEPLAVIVSNRLELPWDAGLFTSGCGRVVVFTSSEERPPETETPLEVVRHGDRVDLAAALRHLREREGVRALLCEGGPRLHAELIAADLVDELFVTYGPKLGGGGGPRMVEGMLGGPCELELRWLLEQDGELFARYAIAGEDRR